LAIAGVLEGIFPMLALRRLISRSGLAALRGIGLIMQDGADGEAGEDGSKNGGRELCGSVGHELLR